MPKWVSDSELKLGHTCWPTDQSRCHCDIHTVWPMHLWPTCCSNAKCNENTEKFWYETMPYRFLHCCKDTELILQLHRFFDDEMSEHRIVQNSLR